MIINNFIMLNRIIFDNMTIKLIFVIEITLWYMLYNVVFYLITIDDIVYWNEILMISTKIYHNCEKLRGWKLFLLINNIIIQGIVFAYFIFILIST